MTSDRVLNTPLDFELNNNISQLLKTEIKTSKDIEVRQSGASFDKNAETFLVPCQNIYDRVSLQKQLTAKRLTIFTKKKSITRLIRS